MVRSRITHIIYAQVVRRDWAPLVNRVMKETCDLVMIKSDMEGAERYVTSVVADLYAGRIELHELLLSKGLSREPEDYTNKQTHAELVKRMRERDPGTAPRVGDRVAYVMVADSNSKLRSEWSECPLYVLEHSLPIHITYYAEHLEAPLSRLLTPVIGEKRVHNIFHGDHTRVRKIVTPTLHRPNTLLNFVVKLGSPCALCKSIVPVSENSPYCATCRIDEKKRSALQQQKKHELAQAEERFAEAEARCRRCQDISADEPINCSAKDCDQLYRRHDRQKKVEQARAVINNW